MSARLCCARFCADEYFLQQSLLASSDSHETKVRFNCKPMPSISEATHEKIFELRITSFLKSRECFLQDFVVELFSTLFFKVECLYITLKRPVRRGYG